MSEPQIIPDNHEVRMILLNEMFVGFFKDLSERITFKNKDQLHDITADQDMYFDSEKGWLPIWLCTDPFVIQLQKQNKELDERVTVLEKKLTEG